MSVAASAMAWVMTSLTNRTTAASSSTSSSAPCAFCTGAKSSPESSRLPEPTPKCSMMSWCTRSGRARCQWSGRGVKVRTQSRISSLGGQAVARCSGGPAPARPPGCRRRPRPRLARGRRSGTTWKSCTRRAGRRLRKAWAGRMSVATSSPAAPATSASASGSVRPRAAATVATRWPRGASSTACRCSSVRRRGEGVGQHFLDGRGHGGKGRRAAYL